MTRTRTRSASVLLLLAACATCLPTSILQEPNTESTGKCSFKLTQQQRCDRAHGNVINYVEINTILDSADKLVVDVNRQMPPGTQNSMKNLNKEPWTIVGLPHDKELKVAVDSNDFRGLDRGYANVYYTTKDDGLRFTHDGLEWTTENGLVLEGKSAWCQNEPWDEEDWTCSLEAQSNTRDRFMTCYFSCS